MTSDSPTKQGGFVAMDVMLFNMSKQSCAGARVARSTPPVSKVETFRIRTLDSLYPGIKIFVRKRVQPEIFYGKLRVLISMEELMQWTHLKKSKMPLGLILKPTGLCDWTKVKVQFNGQTKETELTLCLNEILIEIPRLAKYIEAAKADLPTQ